MPTVSAYRNEEALQAFAEDVYYCSLEYGPEDVRTSLGYYNLAKVFQGLGQLDKTLACGDQACLHVSVPDRINPMMPLP